MTDKLFEPVAEMSPAIGRDDRAVDGIAEIWEPIINPINTKRIDNNPQ